MDTLQSNAPAADLLTTRSVEKPTPMSEPKTRARVVKCHLSNDIGRVKRSGDQICVATSPDDTGHIVTGPYELRLPGRYRVDFFLALGATPPTRLGDFVAAIVDVTTSAGAVTLARRLVRRSELGA